MPPRRPPPLPRSLFTSDGPLAQGSAHLHPSPSSLRPQSIVDASLSQPCSYGGLPLEAALPLVPEVTLSENYKILNPVKKLRYPSKQTEELGYWKNGGPIQLDILLPRPFIDASDWDSFEDVIFKISTGQEGRAKEVDVTGSTLDDIPAVKRNDRKMVVAGLLPPPLAPHLPSQQLVSSGLYQAYVNHMSALSLNEHVYLLFAPPILSNAQPEGARPAGRWWTDRAELERVIRMYASTALECFGAHRIIFGSTNPITMDQRLPGEFAIVPSSDWYTQYACRVMSELIAGEGVGQATDSMNAVFHTSALNVFRTVG